MFLAHIVDLVEGSSRMPAFIVKLWFKRGFLFKIFPGTPKSYRFDKLVFFNATLVVEESQLILSNSSF